jgi:tetratricopeptide (TPR) repeat protein
MPPEQVIFISGKVMTDDGTSVPRDVTIERLCNSRVVQQTHAASNGTFSMQIGGMTGPLFDGSATADADPGVGRFGTMGPAAQSPGFSMGGRRELAYCELQAYSPGFRSSVVNLVEYNASGSVIDVGAIVLQRGEKVQGTTLSATTFAAPKDAKKAYQKGVEAESKGKLPEAKSYFEKTVEIYPKHADAWVRLGQLLERENDIDGARKAYSSALAADSRFVPPYLMLAAIGVRSGAWNDVLNYTDHALELDPLSYPDAYFYNSVANLRVDRVDAAEKSARAAERLDMRHRIPQVHLLLAEIMVKHENYHDAIGEMQTYLKLAPNGKDAEQVKLRLAQMQKDEASAPQSTKP